MNKYKPLFESTLIKQCKRLFFLKEKDDATFDRCIQHVKDQGKSEDSAYAICTAAKAGENK
jgi:hypothetical protein